MYKVMPTAEIFAVPTISEQQTTADLADVVSSYIIGLFELADIADGPWADLACSKFSIELLANTGKYPLRPHLRSLMSRSGITEYSANDIATLAERFFSGPIAEDAWEIHDFLWSGEPTIHGQVDCSCASTHFHEDLCRALVQCVALGTFYGHRTALVIPKTVYCEETVNAQIEMCDFRDERLSVTFPADVSGAVMLAHDHLSFAKRLDPVYFWQRSVTTDEMIAALSLALLIEGLDVRPHFSFKDSFRTSAQFYGFLHEEKKAKRLIHALVELLLGRNLKSTHELRENESGNSPARRRGNDVAWRIDLDYEFHVHYWRIGDRNAFEFASVVTHNDYTIPG